MESTNHQDLQDSKSSSEEDQVDNHHQHRPDHVNDDMGTGRSYECVFCKRGFTTAQALGGHMNIHRKERSNIKGRSSSAPTSNSTTSLATDVAGSYHGVQSYSLHDVDHVKYRKYSPAPNTTRVVRPSPPVHANVHVSDHEDLCSASKDSIPRQQNLLTDDNRNWRSGSSLSLGIGLSSRDCVDEGGDGLDLELRLGHDPYLAK